MSTPILSGTYAFTHATAPGPGTIDYVPSPPDPLRYNDPNLNFDYLPHSVFTLDHSFDMTMSRKAPEWWFILKESSVRLGYMLLCSRVPAGLKVSQEDVLRAVNETLHWRRLRLNDLSWNPTRVTDLRIEPLLTPFQTDLTDILFCDLVTRQMVDVPATFFNRVRASLQLLIRPHPVNSAYRVPSYPIISDHAGDLSGATLNRLISLVEWDTRWGYSHWHRITHDTSGFTSVWFADPGTRSILWHTLRAPSSLGWFAVYYPQEFAPYNFTTEVPITVETISFVLAAFVVEIKEIINKKSWVDAAQAVHEGYIIDFQNELHHIFGVLRSVADGTLVSSHDGLKETMLVGLQNFWFNLA